MVCSLLQGECVVVMTYFMTCLYCPDIFFHHFANKILWKRIFDVVDIMIYFLFYAKRLTSWQNLCHHAMFLMNVLTSWKICWRHDMFLTSWRTFFAYLFTPWRVFDVIANVSMLWHVFDFMTHCFDIYLMSWHILWRRVVDVIDVLWRVCDIMTNFLKYIALIDVMTNVLMSWKFWRHDTLFLHPNARHVFTLWRTFLSWWRIFVIISGTKYNVNVISILWRIVDVMTWFDVMTKCLMSWRVFDFMTNGLTLWHIIYFRTNCLHHDVYLTMTFWPHD